MHTAATIRELERTQAFFVEPTGKTRCSQEKALMNKRMEEGGANSKYCGSRYCVG